ncbi:MAG: hypothetical protein IPP21_07750 [Betaproteobacteria bacterium]|nr:hypothetical protein [Betaproteobacteria bacterium]
MTPREGRSPGQVAKGRLNREIAEQLGISERMVKLHRQSIMEKLNVQTTADLVRRVDRAGLTGDG